MDSFVSIGHVRVIKKDKKTGEIVFDKTFKNQITNFARMQVASIWTGEKGISVPSMISVGNGMPPEGVSGTTPNDTGLWNEISGARQTIDYATVWLQYYTQYSVTYSQSEVIGPIDPVNNPTGLINITEAGLFDANGNLWSHVALNGVEHDNTSTLSIQWQVLHQAN